MTPGIVNAIGSFVLKEVLGPIATFLVGWLWKDYLWPTMQDYSFLYQGTHLASRYTAEFTLYGTTRTEIVELKQRAYRIWGEIRSPQAGDGTYKFEGTLVDNVLRGTYDGTTWKPSTRGSFLLTILPGKKDLEGWFLEPGDKDIHPVKYKWSPRDQG